MWIRGGGLAGAARAGKSGVSRAGGRAGRGRQIGGVRAGGERVDRPPAKSMMGRASPAPVAELVDAADSKANAYEVA